MSSISIIGPGNMASALAGRALAGGNAVEVIGRDAAKAKDLAAALFLASPDASFITGANLVVDGGFSHI